MQSLTSRRSSTENIH